MTSRFDMLITVSLTPDELYQAAIVGIHRRVVCIFNRKTKQHYDDRDGGEWATEIESCCAELAVSKYLDKYWSGGVFSGSRAEFDVSNKQVRHTVYHTGSLIIYPEDDPEGRFILVTGKAPEYCLRGWIVGKEAINKGRDHSWWIEPKGKRCDSWWVPQGALRAIPTPDRG